MPDGKFRFSIYGNTTNPNKEFKFNCVFVDAGQVLCMQQLSGSRESKLSPRSAVSNFLILCHGVAPFSKLLVGGHVIKQEPGCL